MATDPVQVADRYAKDVAAGRQVACKLVRLACQRRIRDLRRWAKTRTGATRKGAPYWFDAAAARRAVAYYGLCKHVKGQWAGQRLSLEPWQTFITVELFGWRRVSDGARRFTSAYVEVAKKNGKTTWAAPLALYMLTSDVNPVTGTPEPQAEVYSFATTGDQARYVWQAGRDMVRLERRLSKRITCWAHHLAVEDGGVWRPVNNKAGSVESISPHLALGDELHAQKSREMWDMMAASRGARTQALLLAITTAGFDLSSVCYEEHDYTRKVLSGAVEDETRFGIIYTLDRPETAEEPDGGDDWHDESTWVKANPSLGVSVSLENLREEYRKAVNNPASRVNFQTKRLNIWVASKDPWMPLELWQRQASRGLALDDFAGETAWVAVDLASYVDVAALAVVVQQGAKRFAFMRFYLPEALIVEGDHTNARYYQAMADEGWLELTPGNVIDQARIQEDVRDVCGIVSTQEIAVDVYQSIKFMSELQEEGLPVVEFRNTVERMSDPMKNVYADIKNGDLFHEGNNLMTWMVSNVVAKLDAKDNIFPRKEHPEQKIDGPVALIMAYSRMLATPAPRPSVYEERGVLAG